MKVHVDRDFCESNGICVQAAPEVFALDDDDQLEILQDQPDEALREHVEAAVRRCPKQALTLID
jgi:ferredoxin